MTHNHQTRSRARLQTSHNLDLSLDMNQVGPTRTTATLTPTTLRNIEQTFLEVPEATSGQQQIPHQAGFVPPFIPFQVPLEQQQQLHLQNTNSNHSYLEDDEEEIVYGQGSSSSNNNNNPMIVNRQVAAVKEDDMNSMCSDSMSNGSWSEKTTNSTPPPMLNHSGASSAAAKTPARRGGRRPNKASNLSPEEQEKRNQRRERNKLAAARCRKRRVDHTNELTEEVEGLEKKKQMLQSDIKQLQLKKEELEFLLEAHRDSCNMYSRRSRSPPDVKPQMQILAMAENIKMEPVDYEPTLTPPPAMNTDSTSSSSTSSGAVLNNNPLMSSASKKTAPGATGGGFMAKPNRPSSFPAKFMLTPTLPGLRSSGDHGIPIQTPSAGIFNFDSLMAGGTGLTPVAGPLVPTSTGALTATERNTMELVTPTSEPAKLVSL